MVWHTRDVLGGVDPARQRPAPHRGRVTQSTLDPADQQLPRARGTRCAIDVVQNLAPTARNMNGIGRKAYCDHEHRTSPEIFSAKGGYSLSGFVS